MCIRDRNKRLQNCEERGATWHRCAPPPRTLHYCDGCLCTGYSPVPNVHIRRDTRPGANRRGCVSRSKEYLPDNTDSGSKGPRQQDGRLIKRYTWICYFRRLGVSCPSVCSSMSLCCFSGLTPCTCCVMRRSDVCLYNVIVSHRPHKPVGFIQPVGGDQNMIIMARKIIGTMCFPLTGVTRT